MSFVNSFCIDMYEGLSIYERKFPRQKVIKKKTKKMKRTSRIKSRIRMIRTIRVLIFMEKTFVSN